MNNQFKIREWGEELKKKKPSLFQAVIRVKLKEGLLWTSFPLIRVIIQNFK